MIESEKKIAAEERKQKIRERYKGLDSSELELIPAKEVVDLFAPTKTLRVAAYVRVSTDNDEQTSSFELQKNEYMEQINSHPMWEFAGIYCDEGVTGTQLAHRTGMLQMIEDARAGKIDLILTKSIARFARNIVDCLSVIDTLKNLNPPVGVKFEADNIYTLDNTGRMILTILASVAEEESRSKSVIMNWSIEKRFSRGIFLIPELLGYDHDEDGNLIMNEEEAETVKVIFDLFLNGYTLTEIAELLKDHNRMTKLGNTAWSSSSLKYIIENERYCGDILAHKTYTPNFMTHKSVKNRNNVNQYRKRDHHESIIKRSVFDAANKKMSIDTYHGRKKPLPILKVVKEGFLAGYVSFDKDWKGFSSEEYLNASKSIALKLKRDSKIKGKVLCMSGYQRVRSEYFSTRNNPALRVKNGRMFFNTSCLKKFENVEYVELLLNSVQHSIAIRPCDKDNPNAINWGKLKDGRWCVKPLSCKGLARALFDILSWEEDCSYRFRGQFIENAGQKVMIFELDEPETEKMVEISLPPTVISDKSEEKQEKSSKHADDPDEEHMIIKQKVKSWPESWLGSFGVHVKGIATINILEQKKYFGDWDVLSPAVEIESSSTLTEKDINDMLLEAYRIIERWKVTA